MLVEDFLHGQGDDDFVAALEEQSTCRQVQTSSRRLAMKHRHGRNINASPTREFSRGRRTMHFLNLPPNGWERVPEGRVRYELYPTGREWLARAA
jgi:hypothetical protein